MSAVVERVAKVLWATQYANGADQSLRDNCLERARLVIKAMREPTGKMMEDGAHTTDGISRLGARQVWEAMIDCALK